VIIKGKSRSSPSALAAHLGNTATNERVTLVEARGTVAQDLRGALIEMDAYAAGTRCELPLYHANIDPQPPYRLTPEQIIEAVDALEKRLGFEGHARVIVLHEKYGREHIHPVWSRIDLDQMKSVSDSHNYRKHEEVARDLERRFGHERVQGAHAEREGVERPDRTPSRAELRQEERTGIKGKDVKADVTEAFLAVDNAIAFQAALADAGYVLAKGDRRDFVIVDRQGGIHSLARRIDGMKAAELREFMAPIDREKLPDIKGAREIVEDWWQHMDDSHDEAKTEKRYSRAEDYVTQTQAALKDFIARQEALDELNEAPRPERPAEQSEDEERIARILDDGDRDRRKDVERSETGGNRKSGDRVSDAFANTEMSEAQQQRMDRMLDSEGGERAYSSERDDIEPDRQREAPGGGRTRSQ
jgi:hypothetical protein